MSEGDINHIDNYYLQLKTVRSSAIRILFESLKEILIDVNMVFDKEHVKITAMDSSKLLMVHLKLNTSEFEYYYCEKDIVIGVNMNNLYKLIKTVNNNDTISFFVHKSMPTKLNIRIENAEKVTTYQYSLLEVESSSLRIQPKEFESIITMPSSDFQKICRDMTNMGATQVEIKSLDDKLIFSCVGSIAQQETVIGGQNMKITESKGLVQGMFSLKYLLLFTKATNLCSTINIYLTNDYPIIIEYSVASLGTVKFILMPIVI